MISTDSAMVHILHHAPHVLLTHVVHAHAILIALSSRPVSVDPRVFRVLTVSLARLVRLLRSALRLDRSGLVWV